MQVTVEKTGTLGRRLTVSVPAERVEAGLKARLREMQRTVRINGFRPGKVPTAVIERRFGAEIERDVLGELLRESLLEALREHSLSPARPPRVEKADRESDGRFTYVVRFEEFPEVPEFDLSALEVERVSASVSESDVDAMIETLRRQRARWQPVDRPARSGDMVLFEFVAETDEGRHPSEGRERAGTILGSLALGAELEERLQGRAAGASEEAELSFPPDFRIEALAGRRARLSLEVLKVQEQVLPAVDSDFVKGFGIANGDLDRFRAEVRANLERELEEATLALLRREILEQLLARVPDFELPETMVAEVAEEMARSLGAEPTPDRLRELDPVARRRVRGSLIFRAIAMRAGLTVDPARLRRLLARIASTYEDPKAVAELYLRDPALRADLEARTLDEQVIDVVLGQAQVRALELSFDEVLRRARGSAA